MRIKATRKWIEERRDGSRSGAGNVSTGGEKKRKVLRKNPDRPSARNDTSQNPPVIPEKVVNMSVMHGPGNPATRPEIAPFTFPYQPLDVDKSEIRVITLKPGTGSSSIECVLEHVATTTKSRASYKALSYTWGAPEPTRILSLDGIQIQVRENLWQALCHLRQRDVSIRLWVDAICINQEDIPERNHQVSKMGALYNQAEEVIVWLGPRKDGSDIAMTFIKHSVTPPCRGLPLDLSSDLFASVEIRAVLNLLSREYWRRVWIIQEVFRARKVLICCGHETLAWKDLAKFFRRVRNLPPSDLQQIARHPSREAITAISHNPATTLTDHRTSRFQDLETLLMSYNGSLCCDPRDKVYSLLGLARKRLTKRSKSLDDQEWLTIDYSRSPHDLFQVLTLMYLAEVGDRFLVRWMQLLQRILELPAPWTTPLTSLPPMSVGQIACKSCLPSGVLKVGPEWCPDVRKHQRLRHSSVKSEHAAIIDWYCQFSGPRMPSTSRLQSALENLSEEDVARLDSFKHTKWLTKSPQPQEPLPSAIIPGLCTTKVRPFTTHTGRLGFTSCDVVYSDEIIRFHGSDVAWVVPRTSKKVSDVQVKGMAFIIASDNTARDPEFLASYNGKHRYAVPSQLDDYYAGSLDEPWGQDMAGPGAADRKEIEKFDDTRDSVNSFYSPRMTLREWEFWTW